MNIVPNPQYYFAQHIYPCVIEERVILLDLRSNRYFGLDGEQANLIRSLIAMQGIDVSIGNVNAKCGTAGGSVIQSLVESGILTPDSANGKRVLFPKLLRPPLDLTGYDVTKQRRVRTDHVIHLVSAAVSTRWLLKLRSLEAAINRPACRKAAYRKKHNNKSDVAKIDEEQVRELVEIFRLIRLFLFTSQNFCLYDSLVLLEFLAAYGIHPDLVIGVKLRPFQAHAWVQDERFIYNCSTKDIDLMTPILAI